MTQYVFEPSTASFQEIEQLINDPNTTVEELFGRTDFKAHFRSKNPQLIQYLSQEKVAIRIFQLIKEAPNREEQNRLVSYFQSSNTTLHQIFTESVPVSEFVTSFLDDTSPSGHLAAGIVSRIVFRAFEIWPEDVSEVFRVSDKIYPTIIRHIDDLIVVDLLVELMTDSHPGIPYFMWQVFLNLVPAKERENYLRSIPRHIPIRTHPFLPPENLTLSMKTAMINLLVRFYGLKEIDHDFFAKNFLKYIHSESSFTIYLLQLAIPLPEDPQILAKVFEILDSLTLPQNTDFDILFIEQAFIYLSKCDLQSKIEQIITVFRNIFASPRITNFICLTIIDIITKMKDFPEFRQKIQKIIIDYWGNVNSSRRRLLRPIFVQIGSIITAIDPNENQNNPNEIEIQFQPMLPLIEKWKNDELSVSEMNGFSFSSPSTNNL